MTDRGGNARSTSGAGRIVLHVLDCTGHGGDALAALDLARAQRAAGVDARVAIVRSEHSRTFVERAHERDVPAEELTVAGRGRGPSARRFVAIARAVREVGRHGVVHVHSGGLKIRTTDALAALRHRGRRVATLQSPFDWSTYPDAGRDSRRWRRVAPVFHTITAPSVAALQQQHAAGISADRLAAVPNPVEVDPATSDRAAIRRALGLDPASSVVLFVGRLDDEKSVVEIVEGFARIAPSHPNAELVLVGSGARDADCAAIARDAGLAERIHLTGYRTDTAALRSIADVFVHPSRAESFGNSVVEAMGAGLAVVTTAVGVVTELGDDPPVVVVPVGDAEAIADAIHRLLRDPDLRRDLGERARRVAARFMPSRVAADFEAVYSGRRR